MSRDHRIFRALPLGLTALAATLALGCGNTTRTASGTPRTGGGADATIGGDDADTIADSGSAADGGALPPIDAGADVPDSGVETPDSGPPPPPPDAGPRPDAGPGLPPLSSANVYWVGHSLISHRDYVRGGDSRHLPDLVGEMAQARGLGYSWYDHTIPGAPIMWNWRGEQQSFDRRRELIQRGERYDVMVVTEGISVRVTYESHLSPFYMRRFYCAGKRANPNMRIYLYETWHHLYASDPDGRYPQPHVWDFRQRLVEDRAHWERIADEAVADTVPRPRDYTYGEPLPPGGDPGECNLREPIHLVPVGTALVALMDRLASPLAGDDWTMPGGGQLDIHHLMQNGYRDWPANWPVPASQAGSIDPRPIIARLNLIHPGSPADDIHHNATFAYFIAMVHFATIYGQTPVGLPVRNGVPAAMARQFQEIAWDVVRNDPRTGVR
jgi:hypothetical protein